MRAVPSGHVKSARGLESSQETLQVNKLIPNVKSKMKLNKPAHETALVPGQEGNREVAGRARPRIIINYRN